MLKVAGSKMTCELDVWRLFQHPSGNHHVGVQEESCAADIGWWQPAALFIYGSRSFVVFVFPPLLLRVSARTLVYRDNPAVGRVAIESRSPYLYYFGSILVHGGQYAGVVNSKRADGKCSCVDEVKTKHRLPSVGN